MKRNGTVLVALLSTLVLSGLALAATQPPAVEPRVVGGGGRSVSAGSVTVDNTVGQPVVGGSSAGALELCAGFWCVAPTLLEEPLPPVASFEVAPDHGIMPLSVQFTDTSAYTPTTWVWAFGDGETSTEQHPTHLYPSPGAYTVTLTVANDDGSDVATRPGYITVTPHRVYLPVAARNRAVP